LEYLVYLGEEEHLRVPVGQIEIVQDFFLDQEGVLPAEVDGATF